MGNPRWFVAILAAGALMTAGVVEDALVEAQKKLNQFDMDGAYSVVHAVVEKTPNAPDAWVAQGDVDFRRGDIAAAEMDYKHAINIDKMTAQAWLGLGRTFESNTLRQKAKLCYVTAYKIDPRNRDIQQHYEATLPRAERMAHLRSALEDAKPEDATDKNRVRKEQLDWLESIGNRTLMEMTTPGEHTEVKLAFVLYNANTIRGFSLPVSINGGKPLRLVMDSGASGIVLNSKVAANAGLTKIRTTHSYGFGDAGLRTGFESLADHVSVGSVDISNVPVDVLDRKDLTSEDGLIGTDVFEKFLITIDFQKMALRLDPLPPHKATGEDADWQDREIAPEFKNYSIFFRYGHEILIQTGVNDSKPVLFIMDTGASDSLIDPNLARKYTKVGKEDLVTMRGISGKAKNMQSTDFLFLTFAGYHKPFSTVLSYSHNVLDPEAPQALGFLGMSTLIQFRIQLDYRDGLISFDYIGPKY